MQTGIGALIHKPWPRWPLLVIAVPAAVAVWSGWVGLAGLCGFGLVRPLPGIASGLQINSAFILPVGVEAYGAYALGAWLVPMQVPDAARKFAKWSAIGALALGMLGQAAYHVLAAAHATRAPWPVVVLVSCLPVATLGVGAALSHLLRSGAPEAAPKTAPEGAPCRPSNRSGSTRTRTCTRTRLCRAETRTRNADYENRTRSRCRSGRRTRNSHSESYRRRSRCHSWYMSQPYRSHSARSSASCSSIELP